MALMARSILNAAETLEPLTEKVRRLGWTDTAWSARAGVRKETLSRLRRRGTCDLSTLQSLAAAVGAQVTIVDHKFPDTSPDGHFPSQVDRAYEERLVELSASGTLEVERWQRLGPKFFMAGLAVLLASVAKSNRGGFLALAEELHPGVSEPAAFTKWLERSPVRPTRFLGLLGQKVRFAT